MTAGSAGSHVIVMNVSPALIWSFKSKPLEGLFTAIFGLTNNGPEWSYFFHIFECIFDGSEWVGECDHSSVGENTPQTCRWPIWLRFHVASFGDSDCSSKDVVITAGTTKRHVFFWGSKLLFRGLYLKKKKNPSKRNKEVLFISFSKEVLAIITP